VKIEVEVLWIVTPCNVVVGHNLSENFSATIFIVKMEAILHGVTTQRTPTWNLQNVLIDIHIKIFFFLLKGRTL